MGKNVLNRGGGRLISLLITCIILLSVIVTLFVVVLKPNENTDPLAEMGRADDIILKLVCDDEPWKYIDTSRDVDEFICWDDELPTKSGYLFGGFYTEKNGGGCQVFDSFGWYQYSFPENYYDGKMRYYHILYAYWLDKLITFDPDNGDDAFAGYFDYKVDDDGSLYEDFYDESGENAYGTLAIPAKDGYVFRGYWTERNGCGSMMYAMYNDSMYPYFAPMNGDMNYGEFLTGPITLYARWDKDDGCNIMFTAPQNSESVEEYRLEDDNEMPSTVTVPELEGYSFGGYEGLVGDEWDTVYDSEGKLNSTYSIYDSSWGDLYLTAIWSPDESCTKYTVTLDDQNADIVGSGSLSLASGWSFGYDYDMGRFSLDESWCVKKPVKIGYIFKGYYDQPNGQGKQYINEYCIPVSVFDKTSDSTLYAYWVENETESYLYPVNLITNGGKILQGNIVFYDSRAGATLPTNVKREGYTFGGWYYDLSSSYSKETSISEGKPGAKTLYAKWVNEYSITLNTNGGTINSGKVTTYTYGTGATLPTNVTRTGYTFAGWYESSTFSGSAVTSISTTATGAKTYYAKWIATITVAESLSGAADTLTGAGTYVAGASVTLKAFPKIGYGMRCWLKNGEEFSGNDAYEITIVVDGNATYTAVFSEIGVNVEEFLVGSTYGGVAYVIGKTASEMVNTDTITVSTMLCATDYVFVGWYLDNDRVNCLSTEMTYHITKAQAYKHVLVAVYKQSTNANISGDTGN